MGVDCVVDAVGECVDRLLETFVLEGRHPSTPVADEVMMMLTAWIRGLEARGAIADIEPLYKPEIVE